MTSSIRDKVAVLEGRDAVRVLALVLDHGDELPDPRQAREIEQRIREAASAADPAEAQPVDAGELARDTLRHLAETEQASIIAKALTIATDRTRFDLGTIGIGALIVIALKTEVKLTRSEEGRWSLLVHKRPMRDSQLGSLISKLLTYCRELGQ